MDFGIGRLLEENSQLITRHTEHSQLLGTLAYISPEQIAGESTNVDTRTDIYALGVICYELLSGALPIDVGSGSVLTSIQAVCETTPRSLGRIDARLKGDVSVVVARALSKEPGQRHASADALGEDIRRILTNQPILSRPTSRAYAMRKFVARHPLGMSLATVATLAILAGATGSLWGMIKYRTAATELTQQNEQMRDTSNLIIHEVMTNLSRLAGTADIRQHILQQLSANINALLDQHPTDPGLLSDLAMALELRSDLIREQGDYASALSLRQQALDTRQQLLAADADNSSLQADLSINLVKVGDLFKDRGNLDAAKPWYLDALVIDKKLASEHPMNRRYLDNLGWSYDRLANLAHNQQDPAAMDRYLIHRQRVNDSLLTLAPDHPLTLYALWSTHMRGFDLANHRQSRESAIHEAQAAVEVARTLVTRDPENRDYLLAMFDAIANQTSSLYAVDRLDEAKAALLESAPIVDTLTRLDPNNADSYVKRITRLEQLSLIALDQGAATEALRLASEAVATSEQTLKTNPNHFSLLIVSTSAMQVQINAQLALGDQRAAAISYARVIELFERRVEMSQGSDDSLLGLADHLCNPPPGVAADASRAIEVLTPLLVRDTDNDSLFETLGQALILSGDTTEAIAQLNRALVLAQSVNASARTIDSIRQLLDQAFELAQANSAAAHGAETSPELVLRP